MGDQRFDFDNNPLTCIHSFTSSSSSFFYEGLNIEETKFVEIAQEKSWIDQFKEEREKEKVAKTLSL